MSQRRALSIASGYGYSCLDVGAWETRLPTLPPGPPEAAIRIKVDALVLTEYAVPQSEAVSYTWGFTESTRISFAHEMYEVKVEILVDNIEAGRRKRREIGLGVELILRVVLANRQRPGT